ncbi:MAG: hypothetical protein AB1716_17290, partial [Planctomycetota bacterium]
MGKAPQSAPAPAAAPLIDVARLEALTLDVMRRMRTLRELLAARAAALQDARDALDEYRSEL